MAVAMKRLRMAVLILCLLGGNGCMLRDARWAPLEPPRHEPYREFVLETTGYCKCGDCCGWRRNWLFRPVVASGPNEGKPKAVGYTSSGVRARPGTIAADTSIFPFGTVMYIPGYGYGRVEDRGQAITGYHVDLYFLRHADAERWGRVKKKVKVWPAPRP